MDGIKCFLTSKKALTLIENKKYSFLVQRWIKKNTIKEIIENFFEVKVISINSCNLPKKKRRLGKFKGYKTQYKKIIVTLDPKDNIQLFSNI
jgi:large subunit ribosomal protein L23